MNMNSNTQVDSAKTNNKHDSDNGVPDKLVRRVGGTGWFGKLLGGASSKEARSGSELRESTSDDLLGSSRLEESPSSDVSESLVLNPLVQAQNAVRKGYEGMGIPRQNIDFLPSSGNDVVVSIQLNRQSPIPENRQS